MDLWRDHYLKGNIRSVMTRNYYVNYENGKIDKGEELSYRNVYYEYNKMGKRILLTKYRGNREEWATCYWKYNEKGQLIFADIYEYDYEQRAYKRYYEYDAYGNQVKEIEYYNDGNFRSIRGKEYDSKNNLILEFTKQFKYRDDYDPYDECTIDETHYDEKGNQTRQVCITEQDGKVKEKTESKVT